LWFFKFRVTRQFLSLTASMSWTRPARSWFSSAFRTRPARAALRQFSIQGSSSATQHSLKTLLFTSLTAGLVGFTIAKSLPTTLGHETESTHPQFGSSDDFKKAIQELQSTFPTDDKVSVDPDDLQSVFGKPDQKILTSALNGAAIMPRQPSG
jgi:D-lactate dehydrogenase (cytochrome)